MPSDKTKTGFLHLDFFIFHNYISTKKNSSDQYEKCFGVFSCMVLLYTTCILDDISHTVHIQMHIHNTYKQKQADSVV